MNKKLLQKMFDHIIKLYYQAQSDELLYGESYVEFGDRNLSIIDKTKVEHDINTIPNKIYGESPIEPIYEKMSFVVFCETILGVKLNDYQKEFVEKWEKKNE